MSKDSRFISALGAVLFALVGLSACGGGIPGDAVVQVGGTPITKTAFDHWMSVAAASSASGTTEKPVGAGTAELHDLHRAPAPRPRRNRPKDRQRRPRRSSRPSAKRSTNRCRARCFGFLISSQWVLGEASSLGVKLSDAEVKKEFTKIKTDAVPESRRNSKNSCPRSGQTVSDLLLRVKLNLLSQKIQKQIIKEKSTVTQAQITKYYNENKSKYGTPEKRNVRIILTKTEAQAASAKKEIESGKSFASVAKKDSIDPTSKANGGLLKEVVKGEEEKALDTAIFSASKGVLGGPVKTPFGYYVYEVVSITPGTQEPLSQVKSTIKAAADLHRPSSRR